ncbi:hypothetical protein HRI_002218500 [Hibiscus trionum]|uniref:Uncharacterized protein n=1 Tax=Hibiscus trionum TaxID=183268 RepID=A0A9W7HY06_HIBTR|nr:hypothetical protein HRI_002218500 [Hibiscus trionum]
MKFIPGFNAVLCLEMTNFCSDIFLFDCSTPPESHPRYGMWLHSACWGGFGAGPSLRVCTFPCVNNFSCYSSSLLLLLPPMWSMNSTYPEFLEALVNVILHDCFF